VSERFDHQAEQRTGNFREILFGKTQYEKR